MDEEEFHEGHRRWMEDWWKRAYVRSMRTTLEFLAHVKRRQRAAEAGAYGAEQLELELDERGEQDED